MNTTLPLPFDKPAPSQVVAVAEPAATGWLHLPSLHVKLLPLALAAGHAKLHLAAHVDGPAEYYYEAEGSGGSSFRRYISFFDYGSTPAQFELTLTTLLEQQIAFLAGQGKEQADV